MTKRELSLFSVLGSFLKKFDKIKFASLERVEHRILERQLLVRVNEGIVDCVCVCVCSMNSFR